jgi:hypothetical protein
VTAVIKRENCVGVLLEWRRWINQPQLPRHPEVNNQDQPVPKTDEDVLSPPAHRLDPHSRDGVDEQLGFGMADDRGEGKLTADDGATDQVRPEVVDYRFDLR